MFYLRLKKRTPSDIARDRRRRETFFKRKQAEIDLLKEKETAVIFLTEPESAAYPAPGNTAFQVPDSGANEAKRDLMEGQETAIIFLTEPESAAYPAPGNTASPVPDSGVNEALAENNRALKRRLLEAVMVANGCHRALKRERGKADEEIQRERRKAHEEITRLKFHLQLGNEALKSLRSNPKGVKLGPTPEEAQAFVAEQERKKVEAERRRQKSIEDALKHKLESTHWIEQRKKERKKEQDRQRTLNLPKFGPETRLETKMKDQTLQYARAIGLAHGRTSFNVSDYREAMAKSFRDLRDAAGVRRGASAVPTRPAASPSLEHCTRSSSGPGCA